MTELCDLDAVELRWRIGRKEISPVELLESCLARIEAVNPALNAVVATAADGWRQPRAIEFGPGGDLVVAAAGGVYRLDPARGGVELFVPVGRCGLATPRWLTWRHGEAAARLAPPAAAGLK